MKRIVSLIICLLMTGAVMTACGEGGSSKATEDSAQSVTAAGKAEVNGEDSLLNVQTYEIKSHYCTLKYPAMWEDAVTVDENEKENYTLSFTGEIKGKKYALFDLVFDSDKGIMLGTLKGDKPHTLSMIPHDIDEKECGVESYTLLCGMQEDVNVIVANLKKDYDFETKNK